MNSLTGVVIGILLLVLTSGISFYAGYAFGQTGPTLAALEPVQEIVEVEVTREVTVEVETEVEVTRIVEVEVEVPVEVPSVEESMDEETAVTEEEEASSDESAQLPPLPTPVPTEEPTVPQGPPIEDLSPDDLSTFFEVMRILESEFDGDLPSVDQLNYELVEAAIDTLDDQFTSFAEPALAEQLRESMSGTYEGIGAFVGETEEGYIEITQPIRGLPADLAGIESGDLIIEVDGVNVVGKSVNQVVTLVRGPKDTEVRLGIARVGEPDLIEITVVRASIEIPTVEYEMLEDDIGYIRLANFNSVAAEQMRDAYAELAANNPKGLILDVRDNPGGFLNISIDIADLFLPESIILLQKNNKGLNEVFEARDGDPAEGIPLVVLVNEGSASASELVAGALRDNDRATIIGEVTFGKGSVQRVYNLTDGSELRVTYARWFTPKDVNISEEGIIPDIVVEFPEDAIPGEEGDTQLEAAIDFLSEDS
ncbi:MAG: S41 family peptidase [Chloroflexota bacterium]